MQSLGITRAQCLEKTRMMALLNLAQSSANKPIPYDHISSTLQIDRSHVEQWIVKATGSKLITARIDQLQQVVSILTCTRRGFDGTLPNFPSAGHCLNCRA